MYKYLLGILAIVCVAVLFAFTNKKQRPAEKSTADSYFIYLPDVPGTADGDYEDTTKWMHSPTPPINCEGGDVTCYIRVAEENLTSGATLRARLVNYLIAQDGGAGEFSNDVAAVTSLTQATKPEN